MPADGLTEYLLLYCYIVLKERGFSLSGHFYMSLPTTLGMMRLSHHKTVIGGTTHGRCTVRRAAVPPDGVPGFHQPDAQRVSAARPALRDRVPDPDGGM